MNPTKEVREILRVAKLESVFEICEFPSTEEIVDGKSALYVPRFERWRPVRGLLTHGEQQ